MGLGLLWDVRAPIFVHKAEHLHFVPNRVLISVKSKSKVFIQLFGSPFCISMPSWLAAKGTDL